MDSDRRNTRLAAGLIALTGLFYALTIRPGFVWGDDFAMYLAHAQNIAGGQPYARTGYIYNPLRSEIGPPSYPPFYPSLLAPTIAAAGFNAYLIKAVTAVFFLAALWWIYACLRRFVPDSYALAVVVFLAFNPYLWQLKDNPVSDVPFLFLVFLTFDRVFAAEQAGWRVKQALTVGVLLYLCFACRAAGIIMLPSVVIWEILKNRSMPRRGVWLSAAIGLVGMVVQLILIPGEASYIDQLHRSTLTIPVVLRNAISYSWPVRNEVFAIENPVGRILLVALVVLGVAGYIVAVRRRLTVLEIFVPAYLTLIGLWTTDHEPRLLLPVLPLWLLYAGIALLRLGETGKPRVATGLAYAVAGIFLVSYASFFARAPYGPITDGPDGQAFAKVRQFIRDRTAPDATILFSKPRALALLTGRKSAAYPLAKADAIVNYGRKVGAAFLIAGDPFSNDRQFLMPAIAARADVFEPVFQTAGFGIYRVKAENLTGQ